MLRIASSSVFLVVFFASYTFADTEFLLGKETNGFEIKIDDDTNFTARFRFQPRFDIGETSTSLMSDDGKSYTPINDMYLRRVNWEFNGSLIKNFRIGIDLEANKVAKRDYTAEVVAKNIFGDYKFSDAFNLFFGKKKLPYSRVSLISSSKQLIIERPGITEDAKKIFGDSEGHGYYGSQIMIHGEAAEGMFKYYASITDGWQAGQTTRWTSKTVEKSGLAYIGRVEFSPPGWIEKSQSDAHLGEEIHLTLGLHYGAQGGIEYKSSSDKEDRTLIGADISFHLGGLTLQGEYESIDIAPSTAGTKNTKPNGWYAQAGYFISGIAIEPAIRYEYYNKDSEKTDDDQTTIAIGFNWYLKGHSFKIAANYVATTFGNGNSDKLAGDDNLTSFQIQSQFHL